MVSGKRRRLQHLGSLERQWPTPKKQYAHPHTPPPPTHPSTPCRLTVGLHGLREAEALAAPGQLEAAQWPTPKKPYAHPHTPPPHPQPPSTLRLTVGLHGLWEAEALAAPGQLEAAVADAHEALARLGEGVARA